MCIYLRPSNGVFISLKLFSHLPFPIALVQVPAILLTLKKKEGKGFISFGNSDTDGPELGENQTQGSRDVWPSVSECVCVSCFIMWSVRARARDSPGHTPVCHPCDQGQGVLDLLQQLKKSQRRTLAGPVWIMSPHHWNTVIGHLSNYVVKGKRIATVRDRRM